MLVQPEGASRRQPDPPAQPRRRQPPNRPDPEAGRGGPGPAETPPNTTGWPRLARRMSRCARSGPSGPARSSKARIFPRPRGEPGGTTRWAVAYRQDHKRLAGSRITERAAGVFRASDSGSRSSANSPAAPDDFGDAAPHPPKCGAGRTGHKPVVAEFRRLMRETRRSLASARRNATAFSPRNFPATCMATGGPRRTQRLPADFSPSPVAGEPRNGPAVYGSSGRRSRLPTHSPEGFPSQLPCATVSPRTGREAGPPTGGNPATGPRRPCPETGPGRRHLPRPRGERVRPGGRLYCGTADTHHDFGERRHPPGAGSGRVPADAREHGHGSRRLRHQSGFRRLRHQSGSRRLRHQSGSAGFATKADLAGFATKADLAGFATKADLAGFAAKRISRTSPPRRISRT